MTAPQHAVVIGSGIGGLTAGVLLATHGYKVTVLERHFRPGGFLHRFFREGVPYDTGFHYCGGVGPDHALGRVLRHLGVFDDLDFLPLEKDGFDRLRFPDGFEFKVPVGMPAYRAALKETFPSEAVGIDAFCDAVLEAVRHYGLYNLDSVINVEQFVRWESLPLAEFIDSHVTDPRCRAVLSAQSALYGVPAAETPFGLHAIVLSHFLEGPHSIVGGGDALAMAMVRRLRGLGAEVRLRAEVTGIQIVDRRARAVELADGSVIEADVVVSGIHPRLMLDLVPDGTFRKVYTNRVQRSRVGIAHLGIYAEIDGPVPEIGNANVYRHMHWDASEFFQPVTADQVHFYFAAAPGERTGSGRDVLLLLVMMDWAQVAEWADSDPADRPPEYLALKQAVTARVLEQLVTDFPSLKGRIRRVESSTPLTTHRFTATPMGAIYGHYHCVEQMGRYRPSQINRIRNMIMVGQGVFLPGIIGASLSAYYGCSRLLGMDLLVEEMKAACAGS